MPSTSSTPRIKQEQTLHVPSHLKPILKQSRLNKNRGLSWNRRFSWRHHSSGNGCRTMTCEAQCVLRIPVSRFAMDHGTGISGTTSRVTVFATSACGPATEGSGFDKRLWTNPKVAALGCKLGPSTRQTPNYGGGGGLQGLLLGRTPIASCRGVPAPVRDTLRNWRRFAVEQLQAPCTDCGPQRGNYRVPTPC